MKQGFLIAAIIIFFNTILFASYKEALKLYESKKFRESLLMIADELQIEMDIEPESPNYKLRFLAAHNHWKLGSYQSAIAHLKKCIDLKKDNVDPLIDLSLIFIDMKRYGDARYFANKALKMEESSIIYFLLGKIASGYRNYWKAKEYFEKAISIDPDLSLYYNCLGITLMRLKKYNQANTAFSAAMAITPDSPEILNNIGISIEKTGKLKKAFKYIQKASVIKPDDPVIQKNLDKLKKKTRANKVKN